MNPDALRRNSVDGERWCLLEEENVGEVLGMLRIKGFVVEDGHYEGVGGGMLA